MVTAESGGIDTLVEDARVAILPFFGLGVAAAILSSLLLTAMIAQPIRQLAIAADKVREGIAAAGRVRIPDFTKRHDEIGELSGSLKSMTAAIYARIDAIESFAADVAHELKNPLTSIRSASETLEFSKTPEQQAKLMQIIQNDVARMDRLITDISNASRLDAELARETREAVDLTRLIGDITAMYGETAKPGGAKVEFRDPIQAVYVLGNPTALSQVVRNLIDNARSFSPPEGVVRVILEAPTQREQLTRIIVEDDGPGIPPDNIESVFKRFYTKRPKGAVFGNNSGLGLSISRQIINSHGGRVYAENRLENPGDLTGPRRGASFIVELPTD
jgi:two-component system, OmpR family, sensor histidine kinase ChvG